ncbi:MAG TPA: M1 family aminopeptidase [Salinimicrobium sp.]|nr:M1 family aminopeptidase [Salinimicrobium sp.]
MMQSLINFEIRYQQKQKSFVGFALLFLILGFLLGKQGFAPPNVDFNSHFQIFYNSALISLSCVFPIMFFCISGVLRDKQYEMESLVYATPIQKNNFFLSRFYGVFLFSLISFSTFLIGFFLGTQMPNLDSERLQNFELLSYLWIWMILIVPNIFICTSLIFSVSLLSKNSLATYMIAIAIYALYWICSVFINSPLLANTAPTNPEILNLAAIADPFGLSAFFEQTQYWSVLQKNENFISLSGKFLWNRFVWLCFSGLILIWSYKKFDFKISRNDPKGKSAEMKSIAPETKYVRVQIETSEKSSLLQFFSLLKIELKYIFGNLPFIAVSIIWVVLILTEILSKINHVETYNDSLLPATNLLIREITNTIHFFGLLLVIFYSGELVWRERSLNLNGVINVTPSSNATFFLAKGISLLFIPISILVIGVFVCIGFQISKSYFFFEIGQYIDLFYYSGITFVFYSMLSLFLQNLIQKKHLAMLITGIVAIVFGTSIAQNIGLEHPMLQIGNMPEITFSNMNGYGRTSFHYFAIYWLSFGLLLTFFSFRLWKRREAESRTRWKQIFSKFKKAYWWAFFGLFAIFLTSGFIIFYNTNIAVEYISSEENLNRREAYEKKYKQYENLQKLVLVDAKTEMNLYPEQGKYDFKANYILENTGDSIVIQILITENEALKNLSVENATLLEHDTKLGTYLFIFKKPVIPGQKVKFSYEIEYKSNGFTANKSLLENGSYLMHNSFEPSLSYNENFEIQDHMEREKRNLPKKEEELVREDDILNDQNSSFRKIDFETIVSTETGQIALAPGDLLCHWKENGRNYFQYKSPHKIAMFIAYFSADYAVQKEEYKEISIEQYYHPPHFFNIDKIENSSKMALDYCLQNFGDYPLDHLRIAEIPSLWNFGGQALPGTISMVEDRLYLIDDRNPQHFDLVAKRTIHEVAHQYWGHILTPKNTEGAAIFTEGFAKYTEAVVMEKLYGKSAVIQLSEQANERYFSERAFAEQQESPLYLSNGESYLSYGKNYISMLATKELIGEEKVNSVLKSLLGKFKDDVEPKLTSLDFLKELYKVTPKNHQNLIDDWFKKIITYDLKVDFLKLEKLENESYKIEFEVTARKFEDKENGEVVSVSIDEPIQIGVFTENPNRLQNDDQIIYLKPHRINKGKMKFSIVVKQLPKFITIDPLATRLDAKRIDNIDRVSKF